LNWELISITIACLAGVLLFAFDRLWPGEGARKYRAVPLFFIIAALGVTTTYQLLDKKDLNKAPNLNETRYANAGGRPAPAEQVSGLQLKVVELEKKLSPFSQIASAKFPQIPEDTALGYLKDDLNSHAGPAQGAGLMLTSVTTQTKRGIYVILLEFTTAPGSHIAKRTDLTISLPPLSEAKILRISPLSGAPDEVSFVLTDKGKRARLIFASGGLDPTVEVDLTSPTPVRIESPELAFPVSVNLE
jgi:hypothetical protein